MTDYKKAARALISQMTLEEKVSQMLHGSAAIPRLGIPAYNWWNEALHGVARAGTATVFPQAIAMAAMFDEELIYEIAVAVSDEGRAKYHAYQEEGDRDIYKGLTFWSPNINIFRDPRWGRGHETYGEDPYLTARLGIKFVNGLQGPDKNHLKTAACAKHFAVHSGPEGIRHEFDAVCNDYDLWNTYLPQFEAMVYEADVEGFMPAYNRTNGEPCCGSTALLVDILRGKWSFDGYVTSDCWAIKDFHEKHKVTSNATESVALAVNAGCHLNCGNLYGYCLIAVKEGLLSEEKINDAVEHLYVTRMKLGLLGAPEIPEYINIPYDILDCPKHKALNLKASQNGIVMLKNDGALPLDPAKIKSVAVIGPNANNRTALIGNYFGTARELITVVEGISEKADEHGFRVYYAEGCHLFKDRLSILAFKDDRESEAVSAVKHSDAVVVCLGLDSTVEGEENDLGNEFGGGDKEGLNFPGRQQHLLEKVTKAANGKPVILVTLAGSAMAVTWADENVGAILHGFYPGAQGGRAIADIIFGKVSPSGKLPVTFYRSDTDLPDFCDYNMENRTYRYFRGEPLYPFGFGLGYCKFEMSGVGATENEVTLTVKNNGSMQAAEIVQVYASNPNLREVRSLIGFKRTELEAGQSKTVVIPLDKNAFFRRDSNGDLYKVGGKYEISVGFSQPDERSVRLCGVKPAVVMLNV
ncbi:MAG: glycoside hydrolase family 3 C-terminal domain-containing protein [Oscillospiraceae bacterium]|jgi:beta-glucosidase|nr:glycoside hydrolase family 3 C-terminal domain-containing protein [Oscillospiraceae bacterium]